MRKVIRKEKREQQKEKRRLEREAAGTPSPAVSVVDVVVFAPMYPTFKVSHSIHQGRWFISLVVPVTNRPPSFPHPPVIIPNLCPPPPPSPTLPSYSCPNMGVPPSSISRVILLMIARLP